VAGHAVARRLDADHRAVPHPQPPDLLADPDLRAVAPGGVDERFGGRHGVDGAVARAVHRSRRRHP
jgi:hypothetical protein